MQFYVNYKGEMIIDIRRWLFICKNIVIGETILKIIFIVLFTSILILIYFNYLGLSFLSFNSSYSTGKIKLSPPLQNGFNSTKIIILAFDDSPKSQFTLAKPVLDKYVSKVVSLQYAHL